MKCIAEIFEQNGKRYTVGCVWQMAYMETIYYRQTPDTQYL